MTIYEYVSIFCREYLAITGMKQAELAEELGISRAALSSRLNNRTAWHCSEYLKLCDFLKIPADSIINSWRTKYDS